MHQPKIWIATRIVLAASVSLAAGCRQQAATPATAIRVNLLPQLDPAQQLRESRPLQEYLARILETKVNLTIAENYPAAVQALCESRVDLAQLGGLTYLQANARCGALPVVQRERDKATHSMFITQVESPIHSLNDLTGHSFAFGKVDSGSGHLMPRFYMQKQNVDPTVLEKAIHTDGHYATGLAVANKTIDAGVLQDAVFDRMMKEGKLNSSTVRVFYKTPPYVDDVWAARKDLSPMVREGFVKALMALTPDNPEQKPILDRFATTRFLRADDAEYVPLRKIAKQLGLLTVATREAVAK